MNTEQIAVIPPYLVNSPKAGYYDRYAAKVDLELKLNFWAWMKYERICLILGDFLLVYKDEQPYTQSALFGIPRGNGPNTAQRRRRPWNGCTNTAERWLPW